MKIINKKYLIKTNKINTKIVFISDLHYYNKTDLYILNRVLDNIKRLNPKYICISGDILDESNVENPKEFTNWLKKLTNVCTVVMTLGNHEYYINKKKNIYGLNKKILNDIKRINNLYLLINENKIIDNINFIALTLPIEHYMIDKESNLSFDKYLGDINSFDSYYNILLCHSPKNLLRKDILEKICVNLILCGHMHGGIMPNFLRPIFKHSGLIEPSKKFFPKNVYGHLNKYNTDIIISSGVNVISHINPFRIFRKLFNPEIVSIYLKK